MPLGTEFAATLLAAQAGDEHAWARLYGELSGNLLGYLRARGAREPEDLIGEVFVQLARNLRRFRGNEGAFRGWVFLVARNRLVDERRQGRYATERLYPVSFHPELRGDVETEALASIGNERVDKLLARLTPEQRDVVLLRVVGDLSLEQTASLLRKRVGAVKQLQRRALAALRRELAREGVTS